MFVQNIIKLSIAVHGVIVPTNFVPYHAMVKNRQIWSRNPDLEFCLASCDCEETCSCKISSS